MEGLSFNPPVNLSEEGKSLLGVTSFEATNSVFILTVEPRKFSFSTPSYWSSRGDAETNNRL